jgi:DNA-directed RNA polymerase subunit M/transcription elongation factor TFIIS
MHFCSVCENMLYIKIYTPEDQEDEGPVTDNNSLLYYCRKCGHQEDTITKENICVSKLTLKRTEQKYDHLINEYTKLDPTLPRVTNIDCPNTECPTRTDEEDKEVITMRYDDINMKYVYLCAKCDFIWKLE